MTAQAWAVEGFAPTSRASAAPFAQRTAEGPWVIRFPSEGAAWELELPATAAKGLPVRLHLVEVGTHRGSEASAQVPWWLYQEALGTILDDGLEPVGRTRLALKMLLKSGFSPLLGALGG